MLLNNILHFVDQIKRKTLTYKLDPDTMSMIPGVIVSIGLVIYCNL